jgi:hypothetical protein
MAGDLLLSPFRYLFQLALFMLHRRGGNHPREVTRMLIWVNYADDRYDYVKDFMLEPLIRSGALKQFKRSTGWVRIGVDPIRKSRMEQQYTGDERRAGAPTYSQPQAPQYATT